MKSEGMSGRRALLLALTVVSGLAFSAQAQADEPANGFAVSFDANGSFARDGAYDEDDPDSSYTEHGTVSADGSYAVDAATLMPVYFPTGGTDKQTSSFYSDPASTFTGSVSAGETMTNSNGGSENSSCSAPYVSDQQDIFPLAYRGVAGRSFEVLVAPSIFANRSSTAIDCGGDDYAVDQLLFPVHSTFDGQSRLPDPPFESSAAVTVTQSQLGRKSFTVPVAFNGQANDAWAQETPPPHGYCEFSVPAGFGGSCTATHNWNGTLTFTRVCSVGEGGFVDFNSPQSGRDGVPRWFVAGGCGGSGGGGGECVVPKLEGKTLKKAKRKLEAANCKLGKVKKAASEKVKKGLIVKQKPKPKTRKPAGAKVKVVVSSGPR